ncbi:MAG: flippase, partial [Candidatus Krumholzibacteria bacterium]|nr:flippase [Candidatus Krumholzibacteria bacterium]
MGSNVMAVRGFKIGSTLRKAIINTGWLFALRILRIGWALFVGVWMARYLGPASFGTLCYAIAFVVLFSPITRLGLHSIVVRDIVREPARRDELLGTTFFLRLIGGIVSFAVVMGVVSIMHPSDTEIRVLVGIIAFGWLFLCFETIDIWFESQVQSKYTVYAKSAALILVNVIRIILIVSGASLASFVIVSALEIMLAAIGLTIVYHMKGLHFRHWRINWSRGRELLGQSWPMILSAAMAIVYLKIDQVMLGKMLGKE